MCSIIIEFHLLSVTISHIQFHCVFHPACRYNYELMEDEYLESLKRMKALEKKIEETRKTNIQILSGKVDHLFKLLKEKDSEIYIRRSKKMYSREPLRTQLFAWRLEEVLLFVIADESLQPPRTIVQTMQDLDRASPWPDDGLEFSTLWCRMLSVACSSFQFILRDYPQPLWDLKKMEVCLFTRLDNME